MTGWLDHVPNDWGIVSPRRHFQERRDPSRAEDVHLTPSQHHGVLAQSDYMALTGSRVVLNLTGADKMKHVEPGDAVGHLRSFQGGLETSALKGKVSTAYTVIRPLSGADPDYFRWVFKCSAFVQEIASHSQSLRDGQSVKFEDLASVELPLPPTDEQRRIADFLDDRVSRIDRIIAARHEQTVQTRERFSVRLEQHLDLLPERVRASRVLRVLPGYAFASGEYSENPSDIPLLRGVNVGVGRLRWDEVVRWPADNISNVAQFRLMPGDVVLGMDRPWIGDGLRIAQVLPDDGEPLLLQRVAKLIPGDDLDPQFMIRAFQSRAFREQVESVLTGLSVPHLSGDQILEYRMPYGELSAQVAAATEIDREERAVDRVVLNFRRSIDLLTEYKSSLITAAVTGELDVTTAGSRIPG